MSEDIGDPKVTIRQTYDWKFDETLLDSGLGGGRIILKAVSISIERDPGYGSDYLREQYLGITAKKDGTADQRGTWNWYSYPPAEFRAPHVAAAKALWAAVHGEFREEAE